MDVDVSEFIEYLKPMTLRSNEGRDYRVSTVPIIPLRVDRKTKKSFKKLMLGQALRHGDSRRVARFIRSS